MKDFNNIMLELSSISQPVADMPNNNPFIVPEAYFSTLPAKLLSRIEQENTRFQPLSPLLESLKKENPFVVPENYISSFKVSIPQKEGLVVPFFSIKNMLKYAAAAAIVGIIATFAVLLNKTEDKTALAFTADQSAISEDAFALYLSESELVENEQSLTIEIEQSESFLVNLNPKLISEILTEIPENDISTYMSLIDFEDLNSMN
jgi:hypothetical protein